MISSMRDIIAYLALLGVPSIFVMTGWCIKACKTFYKRLDILASAQKAQMRGQLLDQFYKYKERGFVYQDQLDEWVNQYDAYHVLVGNNGVLDTRKTEILNLQVKVR